MIEKKPLFIAEVKTKTRSPFGFEPEYSRKYLFEIAAEYGDAVAIHTSSKWGGSFDHVQEARERLPRRKLVVAKGIHPYDEEIRIALFRGADLVTVVGRLPPRELAPVCIWEPNNLDEIITAKDPAQKIMWNERNLATGQLRSDTNFTMARWAHKGWMVQASFIAKPEDVHPKADAFIVGENLIPFIEAL